MALDSTKWAVQTNKSIRYIGPAHGAAGANYVTVLEMPGWKGRGEWARVDVKD